MNENWPEFLKNDIVALEEALKEPEKNCTLIPLLVDEVAGSINSAYNGGLINLADCQMLFKKYVHN